MMELAMKINVFYQAEGLSEIAHLEVEHDTPLSKVKELIAKTLGLEGDPALFLEDSDEPLVAETAIGEISDPRGVKLHVHRCRQVKVSVTFNGKTVNRQFAPAATVARVKTWAAVKQFGMTVDEAGEHVLQVTGTHDRPAPNTHIGTLVTHPRCEIAFNLVPDERVNGAAGEER